MTCQVLLEFKLKPGNRDKLVAWMRKILPDTRSYEGCVGLHLTQNQDDRDSFIVVEQWDSRAHYEKYFQWRSESGILAELADMLDGAPSIRYCDYCGA
jgi:quinol monooxygenase YgiN